MKRIDQPDELAPVKSRRTSIPLALTEETFRRISDLIREETGIFMRDSKKLLLANRIRRRLAALGLDSFQEYYELLTAGNEAAAEERRRFIDAISTNETYFFRGDSHFEALRSVVLPDLFQRSRHIRLWSAGCSTGEEPYTICMVAAEAAAGRWEGRIEVTATDISTDAIDKARRGLYEGRTLALVPPAVLRRYFEREGEDTWRVGEQVRGQVTFHVHNLLKDDPPGRDFDIIFCRNVMIYFDRGTQGRVVDSVFAEALSPAGYLFIGHAESLIGNTRRFRYAQILRSPIYRPVTEGDRPHA
jgi:chemotaxis protein methyltransferase CheR